MKMKISDWHCEAKWRQIGRCGEAKFENSLESRMPSELLSSLASGERLLSTLDSAIREMEFLIFLPQISSLLVPHNCTTRHSDDVLEICKIIDLQGQAERQFVQDLQVLYGWHLSRKGVGSIVDERRHENLPGMRHFVSESHKKLVIFLKRDKFRRKFFRELFSIPLCTDGDENKDDTSKPSVVKLLKLALKSRYSSHIRNALRERDSHSILSTLCILYPSRSENTFNDEGCNNETLLSDTNELHIEGSQVHQNKPCLEDLNNVEEDVDNDDSSGFLLEEDEQIHQHFLEVLKRVLKHIRRNPSIALKINHLIDHHKNEILNKQSTEIDLYIQQINSDSSHSTLQTLSNKGKSSEQLLPTLGNEFVALKYLMHNKLRPHFPSEFSNINRKPRNCIPALEKANEDLTERISTIQNKIKDIMKKWEDIFQERGKEVALLENEHSKIINLNQNKVYDKVNELETVYVLEEKFYQSRFSKVESEVYKSKLKLHECISLLNKGTKGLCSHRENKLSDMKSAISEYDGRITEYNKTLGELSVIEKDGGEEIRRLEKVLTDMEESYEEMRNMKRLKELLQKMQMAEAVKENWAARRIQHAWKRYKARKYRKLRKLQASKKKKKKSGNRQKS